MFENNKTFAVSCLICYALVRGHIFRTPALYLVSLPRSLTAHDFIYPKILFQLFEEKLMLFQTKQAVLGKAMYQTALLAFENRLNFGLSLGSLESSDFKIS